MSDIAYDRCKYNNVVVLEKKLLYILIIGNRYSVYNTYTYYYMLRCYLLNRTLSTAVAQRIVLSIVYNYYTKSASTHTTAEEGDERIDNGLRATGVLLRFKIMGLTTGKV